MVESRFTPGDVVVYRDLERMQWGPWEVVEIFVDTVIVSVEDRVYYPIRAGYLQKIKQGEGVFC